MAYGMPSVPSLLTLFYMLLLSTGNALDMVNQTSQLICSEGLTHCSVTEVFFYGAPLPDKETVEVGNVELKVVLCCSDKQECVPCLQILITIQALDYDNQDSEEMGEHGDVNDRFGNKPFLEGSGVNWHSILTALVKVCISSPGASEYCKAVEFRPNLHFQKQQLDHKMWLLLTEEVQFGIPVVVQVHARSRKVYNLTVPSLQEVCYQNLEATVKDCHGHLADAFVQSDLQSTYVRNDLQNAKLLKAPRLQAVSDHERDQILLRLDITDNYRENVMYQKFWNEAPGEILEWPKGQNEITIPSNSVAPCLCFQVWWKGFPLRRESCPFKNLQEKMQNNVSVSMSEARPKGGKRHSIALNWNVTAPCRLEGEVWLCKKDFAGGGCEEVTGSRQSLYNHTHAGWESKANGHWKKGEFVNISSHPTLCIQIKLHGMDSNLEPQCPFAAPRWRWSLTILIGLLLVCLSILVSYFVQGLLKGYAWRWLKKSDITGVVCGSHVVLLYQTDGDQVLPMLMCRLGSSLQALGFTVSLDLWSRAELSVLGPVPWLHSQLDRIQRQGGKVVLVLTQAAWARADEWGSQGWERGTAKGKDRDPQEEEEKGGKYCPASSQHVDAFSASLSCVLADYIQGRAGERFVLVQFESLPPQSPGSSRPLPELFRGLCLYSLPSQSLGFLTDLAGGRHGASASARRKKAGKLRVASRVLARGVTGASANMLRLTGLPQDCVRVEEEDSWETVPLRPCLTTPPSSPDTGPQVGEMEWV